MRFRRRSVADSIPFEQYQLLATGSDEELVAGFGSIEAARSRWFEVRDTYLEHWNMWGMPQAWWRFEPDIPDHLRVGPAAILSERDGDVWRELDRARRRYLVELGIDPAPPRRRRPFSS